MYEVETGKVTSSCPKGRACWKQGFEQIKSSLINKLFIVRKIVT
jgi:hypothetical protein